MRKVKELAIKRALLLSALITIGVTLGIIFVLADQAIAFFREVSIYNFLTDTKWTPLFTEQHFGILPLLAGTFLTSFIAIAFAVPIGLSISIYLSEYAPDGFRKTVKPLLELLAAVPTLVYGFFALTVVTPFLQSFIPGLSGFNSLSAGLVMGVMILPYVASLSEDALYAVPNSLREAAFGMGSTKLQSAFRVVVPAASSGIIVSIILAVSRAIGETMIVAIAAGQQPNLTLDPTVPIETITTYIVQVSSGDVSHGTLAYKTIFAAGIALFAVTFILNSISFRIRKRFQAKYA